MIIRKSRFRIRYTIAGIQMLISQDECFKKCCVSIIKYLKKNKLPRNIVLLFCEMSIYKVTIGKSKAILIITSACSNSETKSTV